MDISDEIEVEDELRDATIALPFQSLLTTLVFQWQQRNLPNIVLPVQNFVLCIFSFLLLLWLRWAL